MSEQLGAVAIDTPETPIQAFLHHFDYLQYVDREILILKLVSLIIVFLLFLRCMYVCLPLLFSSRELRRRATWKKKE